MKNIATLAHKKFIVQRWKTEAEALQTTKIGHDEDNCPACRQAHWDRCLGAAQERLESGKHQGFMKANELYKPAGLITTPEPEEPY